MLKTRTEYTPGQMIRFEAAALSHSATRLMQIMLENRPKLDFLDAPATAGMNSIREKPAGRAQRHQPESGTLQPADTGIGKSPERDRRTARLGELPAGMAAPEPVPLPLHDDPEHDGTERPPELDFPQEGKI